jgi:hypothetical protein
MLLAVVLDSGVVPPSTLRHSVLPATPELDS